MVGVGSGRHWQFRAATTDDYRSIDIRWLTSVLWKRLILRACQF